MVGTFLAALLLAVSVTPLPSFPDRGAPIADEAHIEDLVAAELENGLLPAEMLVAIDSSPGCLLEEEAAESWQRLEIHAANAGIELIARWCYRDLAAQTATFRRNCPRHSAVVDPSPPPVDGDGPPVQGDQAGLPAPAASKGPRICSPPTAKPGNSNHGWGRAVDVKLQGKLLTCSSEGFLWLQDNAHLYGWVHPTWAVCGEPKEEAWHWEWGGTQETAPSVTKLRGFAA